MKQSRTVSLQSVPFEESDNLLDSDVFVEDIEEAEEDMEWEEEEDDLDDVKNWGEEEGTEKMEEEIPVKEEPVVMKTREKKEKRTSAPKKKKAEEVISTSGTSLFFYSEPTGTTIRAKQDSPALPQKARKKSHRRFGPLTLFRGVLTVGIIILAVWAIYGVSLEANLPFWKEIAGPNVVAAAEKAAGRIGEIFTLIGSVHP